jgi:hypothetical protein
MELDPDQRAFVGAVIAPLPDEAAVREELEHSLAIATTFPTQGGDDIAAATARMLVTGRSFKVRSKLVFVSTLLMALAASWAAVVGLPAWKSLHRIAIANGMEKMLSSVCCGYRTVPGFLSSRFYELEEKDGSDLYTKAVLAESSEKDGRILFGDLSRQDPVDRWKSVWTIPVTSLPMHLFTIKSGQHGRMASWRQARVLIRTMDGFAFSREPPRSRPR